MTTKITINGKSFTVSDSNVTIRDGIVMIDGKKLNTDPLSGVVEIKWEGPLANLRSDASVTCGNVDGNVNAGSSVNCQHVEGSVSAGSSVRCEDVGGNVSAGSSIQCGSVGGNVAAIHVSKR